MGVSLRRYRYLSDFERVCEFMQRCYTKDGRNGMAMFNLFEWAHVHPSFNIKMTHRNGIWEDSNGIVAFAFYQSDLGEVFFCTSPQYRYLLPEMLEWAEENLCAEENGQKRLRIHVNSTEPELHELLKKSCYNKVCERPNYIYEFSKGFSDRQLPEGFSLLTLDAADLRKLKLCTHRGFENDGEPEKGIDTSLHIGCAPHFVEGLGSVIQAPNGEYACFAGMWIDEMNGIAYLEPLCTVPEYRKMGLAAIALTNSMRLTVKYGCTHCIGGVGGFYPSVGFEVASQDEVWEKVYSQA